MKDGLIFSYDLIDSKQVCELCGFSEIHLNRLMKSGDIPAIKIHRTWVFSKKDVEQYQLDRKERSKSDKRIKL